MARAIDICIVLYFARFLMIAAKETCSEKV